MLEIVDAWRSLDLRVVSDDEMGAEVAKLIQELGDFVVQTAGSQPLPGMSSFKKYYRVRMVDEFWPWRTSSDLLYPPPDTCPRGRCNVPGSPVLYCSPEAVTSVQELRPCAGDRFVLIRYCVATPLRLARVVGFFDPNPRNGEQVLSGDGLIAYGIVREFIRAEFTKPVGAGTEFLYKVSAAICSVWLDSKRYHGWLYPSIASNKKECVAFKRDTVDAQVRVESAELLELRPQTNPTVFETAVLQVAELNGHAVAWVPALPDQTRILR